MSDNTEDEAEAGAELMALLTSTVIVANAKTKVAATLASHNAAMPEPGSPLSNLLEGCMWAGIGATVEYLLERNLLVTDPAALDKLRAEMGL